MVLEGARGCLGKIPPRGVLKTPRTTKHAEWPAHRDGLPYHWQAARLWDGAHRLVTLSNDVPPSATGLLPVPSHTVSCPLET